MKSIRKSRLREAGCGLLFVAPALLGTLVFFLLPFGLCLYYSFTDSVATQHFVGLQNYAEMLQNKTFQRAAGNTVKFVAVAIPALNLLALFLALLLRHVHGKFRSGLRTAYVMPLVLPVASVVLFFRMLFHEDGVLNTCLSWFGVAPIPFLQSGNAFFVLLTLYIWKNVGYNMILFLAMLESIPKVYYEEAALQGAGGFARMLHITLPLSVPYLFFILIISLANSFKSFREAFILFGSYPNEEIYMIQHFINNNFENINYVRISVSAILIFTVIFVLVLLLFLAQRKLSEDL